MDGRETSAIEGNLFFSVFLIARDLDQRDFNKVSNGGRRSESFARSLLVAEETTLTTTDGGKKNRDDQWGHLTLYNVKYKLQNSNVK